MLNIIDNKPKKERKMKKENKESKEQGTKNKEQVNVNELERKITKELINVLNNYSQLLH
jgi:hypothetical protein